MSGAMINLIIQLISGAVGGNVAGSAMKDYNLGPLGNSIAGIIGGGIGGQILSHFSPAMAQAATTLDWGAIIGQIASGGIGGGILMVIVGMLKGAMGK